MSFVDLNDATTALISFLRSHGFNVRKFPHLSNFLPDDSCIPILSDVKLSQRLEVSKGDYVANVDAGLVDYYSHGLLICSLKKVYYLNR